MPSMKMPTLHLTRVILLLLIAIFLQPGRAHGQRILRYSDHEPLGGMRTQFIKDVFFAAIEKESKGRLTVDDQWGGKLAISYQALRAVGEGTVVDMAVVVPEYTAKDLPLQQIFKSFPVGPTGSKQVDFFRRAYADIPEFTQEIEKNNVVPLLFATGYPVAFFSTQPLKTLRDLEGRKWRSASFWHFDFLHNAGATPVTMPWGDAVFKALQAKTLDGLMVNVDSGFMLKVHEAAPHVLLSKDLWLGHVYIVAMNRNTWNGLAQQDKESIERAAEIAYMALGRVMDSSFDVMVKGLTKASAQVRLLDRSELDTWLKTTQYQQAQAKWVAEQDAIGVKAAGGAMEKTRKLLNEAMQ